MRLSAGADATVAVGSRVGGRGAWLCGGTDTCLLQALRRRSLARALRVDIDADTAERLRAAWSQGFSPPSRDARH